MFKPLHNFIISVSVILFLPHNKSLNFLGE
nr:MAG TPA: hypothetical protein [Bacteriophage sp.]